MSEDEEGRAHARSAGGIPWAPGAAWHFLWEALVRHTGTAVVIVDGEGRFRFANEEAERSLGPAEEVVGRTIHEYFPPDFAEERLAYIRRVLATKQPLAVVGMVRGTLSIATIRPLQGKDATGDSVMVACRPISQADQLPSREANEPEVVEAEVHDMGPLARLSKSETEVLRLTG
ncbi:MAG: PAS domain-containing protein [Planctomycetes bacterium]|nr:PAS domain-containing protein [Planctomycetota bacterium]